jgi:hypothetical protein
LSQIWALAGGQLVVSTDVRNMSALQADILLNTEMLTVFLDPLGAVGKVCLSCGRGVCVAGVRVCVHDVGRGVDGGGVCVAGRGARGEGGGG